MPLFWEFVLLSFEFVLLSWEFALPEAVHLSGVGARLLEDLPEVAVRLSEELAWVGVRLSEQSVPPSWLSLVLLLFLELLDPEVPVSHDVVSPSCRPCSL